MPISARTRIAAVTFLSPAGMGRAILKSFSAASLSFETCRTSDLSLWAINAYSSLNVLAVVVSCCSEFDGQPLGPEGTPVAALFRFAEGH